MQTNVDELKAEIAKLNNYITTVTEHIELRQSGLEAWQAYRDWLYTHRKCVEAQLEREEAPMVKPTGPCVTLTAHDGVKWDV